MLITSALEGNRRTRAAKTTSTIKMYFNSKGGKMTEKLKEKQGKQQVCNTGSLMQPDKRTDRWAERLVKEEVSDKWTMWPMWEDTCSSNSMLWVKEGWVEQVPVPLLRCMEQERGLMGRDVGGFVVVNDSVAFGLGLVQRWRWGGSETAGGGGSLVCFFSWELYLRSGCNWDVRFVHFSQSLTSGPWHPHPTQSRSFLLCTEDQIHLIWFLHGCSDKTGNQVLSPESRRRRRREEDQR